MGISNRAYGAAGLWAAMEGLSVPNLEHHDLTNYAQWPAG
jgi:hypothetical protein